MDENEIVVRARSLMASYEGMADMIRLGAYRRGSDPQIDEAIRYYPSLERFLTQGTRENSELTEGYMALSSLLEMIGPEDEVPDMDAAAEIEQEEFPPR
jgi:flagellum-specific ATP synthase